MAQSLQRAPQMTLWKEGLAAAEALPLAQPQTAGINCGNYNKILVNVIPSGGANPTITALVWSDKANAFIQMVPAATFAGPGANTPFSFVFEAQGRIVYLAVTTLAAGAVAIEAALHDMNHDLG